MSSAEDELLKEPLQVCVEEPYDQRQTFYSNQKYASVVAKSQIQGPNVLSSQSRTTADESPNEEQCTASTAPQAVAMHRSQLLNSTLNQRQTEWESNEEINQNSQKPMEISPYQHQMPPMGGYGLDFFSDQYSEINQILAVRNYAGSDLHQSVAVERPNHGLHSNSDLDLCPVMQQYSHPGLNFSIDQHESVIRSNQAPSSNLDGNQILQNTEIYIESGFLPVEHQSVVVESSNQGLRLRSDQNKCPAMRVYSGEGLNFGHDQHESVGPDLLLRQPQLNGASYRESDSTSSEYPSRAIEGYNIPEHNLYAYYENHQRLNMEGNNLVTDQQQSMAVRKSYFEVISDFDHCQRFTMVEDSRQSLPIVEQSLISSSHLPQGLNISSDQYVTPERSNTKNKPYSSQNQQSQDMKKVFSSKNKIRRSKCRVCRKSFQNISELREHEETHNVRKQYKCNICPKSYSSIIRFQDHLRVHTGETPYECQKCSYRFTSLYKLTRHRTLEHRFTCEHCSRRFYTLHFLERHMKSVHGNGISNSPHKCAQCFAGFNDMDGLMHHKRDFPAGSCSSTQ